MTPLRVARCGWLAARALRSPGAPTRPLTVELVTSTTVYARRGTVLAAIHAEGTRPMSAVAMLVPHLDLDDIEVGAAMQVDLDGAVITAPRRDARLALHPSVLEHRRHQLALLSGDAVVAAQARVGTRLDAVLDAASGHDTALLSSVSRLVGFGPGLTPSGDDALCGLLLTLAHLDGAGAAHVAIAQAVEDVLRNEAATTAVSRQALELAVMGEPDDAVHAVLASLAEEMISAQSIARLLATGATSGADTLLGIERALRLAAASAGDHATRRHTRGAAA